ncbi:MAG: hypothetical protein IJF40_03600 [Clostridia bacterium]|nr:hypothetical protein [Clostridia bacterium]
MKNFIRELFFDNIEPQTNIYKENKKLSKNMDIVVDREKQLNQKLTGDEKQLFTDYVEAWSEVSVIFEEENFVRGFRMGAKFAYDTFTD